MPALIATLAQIGALILKELLAIIKEPSSRVILFAPALMQALLFGYGATYDLNHAPYAVLDQSRSAASTELLARLDGAGVFTRAATLTSSDQIASQIDAGKALMVISIPADFRTGWRPGSARRCKSSWTAAIPRPPASPAATWRPSWPTSTRGMAPRPRRGRGTARGTTPAWNRAGP